MPGFEPETSAIQSRNTVHLYQRLRFVPSRHSERVRFFVMQMWSMGNGSCELNTESLNELNSSRNEIAFLSRGLSCAVCGSRRKFLRLTAEVTSLSNIVVHLGTGLSAAIRHQPAPVPHPIIPSSHHPIIPSSQRRTFVSQWQESGT
jgi:hypothetical protein